jgi:chemotaxis protein CheZ
MSEPSDLDLASVADEIDFGERADVPSSEVREIVESVMSTLEGDLSGADVKLFGDLEALAYLVQNLRTELSELNPQAIREEHIPTVTDELDAVIAATEVATNSIMEATEEIEQIAAESAKKTASKLDGPVTKIYEACGFQDITGQRITKVVRALKQIEAKVEGLLSAFGDESAAERKAKLEADLSREQEIPDNDLLHGPQDEKEAISQDEIDKLFA